MASKSLAALDADFRQHDRTRFVSDADYLRAALDKRLVTLTQVSIQSRPTVARDAGP